MEEAEETFKSVAEGVWMEGNRLLGEHLRAGKGGMCTRPQLGEAAEALRDYDGGKAIVIALALGVRESHVGADAGAEVLA